MDEYEYVLTVKVSVMAPDKDMADVFIQDYFGPGSTDGIVVIESLKTKPIKH